LGFTLAFTIAEAGVTDDASSEVTSGGLAGGV
jgi:hypothetical protein